MGKILRKTQRGLDARRANYLVGVPDALKKGYTKPGSQNRKKSYQGNTSR